MAEEASQAVAAEASEIDFRTFGCKKKQGGLDFLSGIADLLGHLFLFVIIHFCRK